MINRTEKELWNRTGTASVVSELQRVGRPLRWSELIHLTGLQQEQLNRAIKALLEQKVIAVTLDDLYELVGSGPRWMVTITATPVMGLSSGQVNGQVIPPPIELVCGSPATFYTFQPSGTGGIIASGTAVPFRPSNS